MRYRWAVTGASSGDPVCCDCANVHRDVLPWVGSGVTGSREEYEHVCGNCDRFFYGAMQRRWCSEACGEAVRAQRRRRRRERAREARAVSPQPCIVCGEPFTLARSDARYCSNACRQDAYRKRKLGGATAR